MYESIFPGTIIVTTIFTLLFSFFLWKGIKSEGKKSIMIAVMGGVFGSLLALLSWLFYPIGIYPVTLPEYLSKINVDHFSMRLALWWLLEILFFCAFLPDTLVTNILSFRKII